MVHRNHTNSKILAQLLGKLYAHIQALLLPGANSYSDCLKPRVPFAYILLLHGLLNHSG